MAHQPPACGTHDYLELQRQFQTMIAAHATETPQESSEEGVTAAQHWQAVIEQAAAAADCNAKRTLKAHIILLTYYGLFDTHRYSTALAGVCPR